MDEPALTMSERPQFLAGTSTCSTYPCSHPIQVTLNKQSQPKAGFVVCEKFTP